MADLTTLAAVREFMQVPAAETEQDAITQVLISALSKAAMRSLQREFAPPVDATARVFEHDPCERILDLAPYDLRAVTSVEIGERLDTLTAVDSDRYRLYPYPAPDGVFPALRLAAIAPWTRWPTALVRVTGDWGYASVPEDVAEAVTLAVAIWLRRDVSNFTTTLNLDTERIERPEAFPSACRAMLSAYERKSYR